MADVNNVQISSELKLRVASLFTYLAKHLGIKTTPKVVFTNDVRNAEKPFGLTGYYDPKSKAIRIFIAGRHDTDILRTFAHEIVHHWQREQGTLQNAQSGDGYAQKDPNLRKREMEAYLFGNMLFRDWQDENRYGPPAVPPPMPPLIKENLGLDPQRLKFAVEKFIHFLNTSGILSAYHRDRTSGDMQVNDFENDLNKKVLSSIQQWVQRVNDRGNWENQPISKMIKEDV
jgi:hypothetical protein